jgi:NADH-quinone oxidoreductase subunit M
MINHGFTTAASSWSRDAHRRRGSKNLRLRRLAAVTPRSPVCSSSPACPAWRCRAWAFVSEFLVLTGTFQRYQGVGDLATTGIILAALYILLDVQADDDRPEAERRSSRRPT